MTPVGAKGEKAPALAPVTIMMAISSGEIS